MDRPRAAANELSLLKTIVEILERSADRLIIHRCRKEGSELQDAALQVAKTHLKLAQLSCKPPGPPAMKHAKRSVDHSDLPF